MGYAPETSQFIDRQGQITDLRTATPLTYIWTAAVLDCADSPTTLVESDVATIGNMASFSAYPVTWVFDLADGTITLTYTYPDLIVTMLTPGEQITDVQSFTFKVLICRTISFLRLIFLKWEQVAKSCNLFFRDSF